MGVESVVISGRPVRLRVPFVTPSNHGPQIGGPKWESGNCG